MEALRFEDEKGYVTYEIHGPLFFGSVQRFLDLFEPQNDTKLTVVNFRYSHLFDHSAMEAITQVADRYQSLGKELHLRNLSPQGHRLLHKADNPTGATICTDTHRHITVDRLS
jgi:SulP family sulfate permease